MAFVKFDATRFRPDLKPDKVEKPKKSKKIKHRSDKRAAQERQYAIIRPIFLEGKFCPITGDAATQIHHKKGRIDELLTDVRFFLAVSDAGHKKIEANPEWAYEMGYSLSRLAKDES